MKPRYQHDCDNCAFLGQFNQYDLYYCPQEYLEPTLIARWSSCGPDYSSGLCFGWIPNNENHPLVEARKRAQKQGLDVKAEKYDGKMVQFAPGVIAHKDSVSYYKELFNES